MWVFRSTHWHAVLHFCKLGEVSEFSATCTATPWHQLSDTLINTCAQKLILPIFSWLNLAVITLLQWISVHIRLNGATTKHSNVFHWPRFVWSHVPFPEPNLRLVTWTVGALEDEFTPSRTSLEHMLYVNETHPNSCVVFRTVQPQGYHYLIVNEN